MKQGKATSIATEMGQVAAAAAAKTYASITGKSAGSTSVTSRPPQRTGPQPGTQQTSGSATPTVRIGITEPKRSSYKRGTASTASHGMSIAVKTIRPSHLDNKCLAVSRIDRSISPEQFRSYVNLIAGKPIDILYLKEIQKKDFKKWRTVVLELSPDNYTLLSDENLWDPSVGIKEFSGYKYWRNQNKVSTGISTTIQANTSVGQSWALA